MTPHEHIYLDHNATTPLLPEVVEAMLPYLTEHFGNPSSGHVFGQRAARAVEAAREQVAELLGSDPEEIVFTSGGTEANNLAIRGVMEEVGYRGGVLTSVIEHPATREPCTWLEERGTRVIRQGVDGEGRVSLTGLGEVRDDDVRLVTVMHSNNETGVLQPIEELARWGHEVGALVHTDAAQSVGKVPVNVRALGVDLLSVAGHKLYAPKGVGALYVRRGAGLAPQMLGASHEGGMRAGTENVASIVGLGAACAVALRDLEDAGARMQRLRDSLWERLAEDVAGLKLTGELAPRLPNTLHVRFPGVSGDALLAAAPEVAASTGSACHVGHTQASAVVRAMGVEEADALGSVRLSLGRGSSATDVERAAVALGRAWRRLMG
ncbi:cysteine desulfurase [Lujinxingia vulgaris]|uniref:cysteine desulfurase n=1 Tax=Lujinxingia vulgaris TaxID=2600176 RepID=A0A5C6X804_9DELT|nr:cysteine desulfurase family protein [Lujinxingia vulgaris]TXD37458.1 cysteine desulfurase [Lujinxingia vulgaris]